MPTQHGPIKLQGPIGDITFYRKSDGTFGAKTKSVISKERFATDPRFIFMRQNGIEFGNAGKSAKTLRDSFAELLVNADSKVIPRLQKVMMKCLKADSTNNRGERTVATGDFQFLEEFDFNIHSPLSATLKAPYTATITRTSGAVAIAVPSFIPTVLLAIPQGATHFKIVAGTSAVNFATQKHAGSIASSTFLDADNTATTAVSLSLTVPTATTDPIFVVLGVQFYQEVNGNQNAMNSGGFNAISIVKIDV